MIPCCRKLSLGRRAHRHGHVCLPAWPAGGQFFAKNAKSGPENGPKNASIFWPRFGAHEKKIVLLQKLGPKLRPFSGPKMGPQRCDKIGSKFGPKLAQTRCQRERKDGFAIPFAFKCRVEVEPTPCQVRGRLRKKGPNIMKAVTNLRDGCSLGPQNGTADETLRNISLRSFRWPESGP